MAAPGVLGLAVGRPEAGSRELVAARPSVLREEVRAETIDERAEGCLVLSGLKGSTCIRRVQGGPFRVAAERAQIAGQHCELGIAARPVREKRLEAAAHPRQQIAQPCGRRFARGR